MYFIFLKMSEWYFSNCKTTISVKNIDVFSNFSAIEYSWFSVEYTLRKI